MAAEQTILEDAVARAKRLVTDLERDAADMSKQPAMPAMIPAAKQLAAKESIDSALAAARRMLQALQEDPGLES